MQHSNSSHTTPTASVCAAGAGAAPGEQDALSRIFQRARARIFAGHPDLLRMFRARDDEQFGTEPHAPGASAGPHRAEDGLRVTLDEWLSVFREPIDWALARAERQAQCDLVDLAALVRVREAYQCWLAWSSSGGSVGEARPKLRPADLLTVAGLVVGSIAPGFAERTSSAVRETLLDAIAAVLPFGMTYAPGAPSSPYPPGPLWYVDETPAAPAPYVPPRMPRHVALMCCCRHGYVL